MDNFQKIHDTIQRRTADSFSNPMARLGIGTESLNEGAQYFLTRLTFNYQTLMALYRNSWIVETIINMIAADMVKKGIKVLSEMSDEDEKKINLKLKKLRKKLKFGIQWGRLFGGAIGVMMIKDLLNKKVSTVDGEKHIMELPMRLQDVGIGSFGTLHIVDRWTGVSPSAELEDDESSQHYERPKYYMITFQDGSTQKIHHSWCLEFLGIELPKLERYADSYWGMSVLEPIFKELQKRDNTNYSVANLIFQSSLRVFKFKDFKQTIVSSSKKFQQEFLQKMDALTKYQSNQSATIIDGEDDFQIHSASFSGLDSILEKFMQDVAGAAHIPVNRLWGREIGGMGDDDKNSERNYNEHVAGEQEDKLLDNMFKLLPVIAKSETGKVITNLDLEFLSLYSPDEETRRSTMEREMNVIFKSFDIGAITQQELRIAMVSKGRDYNMFQNLDDSLTKGASKKLDLFETDPNPGGGGGGGGES